MGLTSGPRGAKVWLQQQFPDAFYRAPWTSLAFADLRFPMERTCVLKDGNVNVISMSYIPDVQRFDEYVHQMVKMITTALKAAQIVIVCIDNLACVPEAKLDTQMSRDKRNAARLEQFPITTDDYTLDELLDCRSCDLLVQNRATRYRLIDELFKRVFACIDTSIAMAEDEDMQVEFGSNAHFIVDGIDVRGASRPFGEARCPTTIGTHELIVNQINEARLVEDLGEADLKMFQVERILRKLRSKELLDVDVVVHDTIDTDAMPISMLDHAVRKIHDEDTPDDMPYSYICFKERGKTAAEALMKDEAERNRGFIKLDDGNPGVLLVDSSALYRSLMYYILGKKWMQTTTDVRWIVTRLLIGSWTMGGCDFVKKFANFDVLMDAVRVVCRDYRKNTVSPGKKDLPLSIELLIDNAHSWSRTFRRILKASLEYEPRITLKRQEEVDVLECKDFARVLWTLAYWSMHQEDDYEDICVWEDACVQQRSKRKHDECDLFCMDE
jgi:hypothetical protein